MAYATRENGFTLSRYTQQQVIECDIDSSKICNIMNIIMVKYCKVSVCGYNITDDVYWGKKINKGICELHFQIYIKNLGLNNTNVVINTVGASKMVDNLCKTFKDVVRFCEMID